MLSEPPGPHRMRAWKSMGPVCGMIVRVEGQECANSRSLRFNLLWDVMWDWKVAKEE